MMNKFVFGNADKAGVYFDEENRKHLNNIRLAYAQAEQPGRRWQERDAKNAA
ncbi:MAG: hypothetical protein WKI04_00825 [Ferruginibacter sp.]